MHFGRLNDEQCNLVREAVNGKRVVDFGAGTLLGADILVTLCGAASVLAIDELFPRNLESEKIRALATSFEDIDPTTFEAYDVAFVMNPVNRRRMPALVRLVELAPIVVYAGSNTNVSACGSADLFQHFLCRPLLSYVYERNCTLMILGGVLNSPRQPTGEEYAAFGNWSGGPILYDRQAEELATTCDVYDLLRKVRY